MSRYYYLVAGLPDITLDDGKTPFSVTAFRTELEDVLTAKDKPLVDMFFRKFDNKNLLKQLQSAGDYVQDEHGSIPAETFHELIEALKGEVEDERKFLALHKCFPAYLIEFVRLYLVGIDKKEESISWEDRLSSLYYRYAMETSNAFVSEWFELNLNICNLLIAFTAGKYGLDRKDYIVGDNEIAHLLRTSTARDFGLGDTLDYLPAVQRIAEEADLYTREKRLDRLKWDWLEEHTFFLPFDIETVFSFLCRLEMLERWTTLDKATGEQTFRHLIGLMRKVGTNQ